jgi:hypothetical protein
LNVYVLTYVEFVLGLSVYFDLFSGHPIRVNPIRSESGQSLGPVWFTTFFVKVFLLFKSVFGKHTLAFFWIVLFQENLVFLPKYDLIKIQINK